MRRNGKVLLQQRAPGRVWAGRWNGPGGKIDRGETPEAAVVREVAEETGVLLSGPSSHGTLDLYFGNPAQRQLRVFIFTCAAFSGRVRGGREGKLRWYSETNLPYDRLWPDMRYWLPAVLAGSSLGGQFHYDTAGNRLLSYSLQVEFTPRSGQT